MLPDRRVRERQLESVVAKRPNQPYRPGTRGWLKRKNSRWSRYEAEREAVSRRGLTHPVVLED